MTVSQQSIMIEGRHAKYWLGGSGKPLVLIHGGLGHAHQHWCKTFEAFAAHFQIIAPDLPGFGVSDPLPLPSYQAFLNWLQLLFDMLNIGGPVFMMGHSFGGALSRLFAAENTGYVSRLVLIDGGQILDVPGCTRPFFRLPLLSRLIIDVIRRVNYSRTGLKRAIYDGRWLTPQFVTAAQAASHGFVAAMQQIALTMAPALRTPTCPTLVVWGESDRFASSANGQRLTQELHNARFALIKNAAHMPQIEQPEQFHTTALAFLNGQ